MSRSRSDVPHRILYLENGIGYGGAAICLRHLVRNLDRSQFVPMVVTGRDGPNYREIVTEALWKHIPDRRIEVGDMRETLANAQWMQCVPGLASLMNQGVSRLDDVVNFLPFFLQLYWAASRFKPHLVHVNNEPLCNRAGILVGKILRVPVVCHVRGDQKGSRMMKWLYRLPDHFIPVSHWISEGIGRLGVPPHKRTVIYDGIRLEDMDTEADGSRFRKAHDVAENAFAVGLVGLLIPWKGQEIFLDAAQELRDEIPNLRMLIVGGTPDECVPFERKLRERVVAEGLSETVIFTGHVDDMPGVYNGLDVPVSASTSPEPLGTMVIETMAMGRPLIAPNHGGGAEMANHERTALLFDPGSSKSLAEAIRRLYRDPDLRVRIGRAARDKALKTFSVAEHVHNVQSVYEKLLRTA